MDGPGERGARRLSADWAITAIAVALGFAVFVILRGLTGERVVTWAVASAVGVILFLAARAVRRRRAR
jgi:hypothetical protein